MRQTPKAIALGMEVGDGIGNKASTDFHGKKNLHPHYRLEQPGTGRSVHKDAPRMARNLRT
jgi:hypothetical protein